jgi:hypothetical protein
MADVLKLIDVPDDSILAHKTLTVRPIEKMKLKHLRAFQRVKNAGRDADMDDLALALSGALDGWSEDEVDELTLDEMLLIIGEMDRKEKTAIPNGHGSSFTPPTPATI